MSWWNRRSFSRVMARTRSTISCIGSDAAAAPGAAGGFSTRRGHGVSRKLSHLRKLVERSYLSRVEAGAQALELGRRRPPRGGGARLIAARRERSSAQQLEAIGAVIAAAVAGQAQGGDRLGLGGRGFAAGELGLRQRLGDVQPHPGVAPITRLALDRAQRLASGAAARRPRLAEAGAQRRADAAAGGGAL